jgi:hypothetical protein
MPMILGLPDFMIRASLARHAVERGADERGQGCSADAARPALPKAKEFLADKAYDADWLRTVSPTATLSPFPLNGG